MLLRARPDPRLAARIVDSFPLVSGGTHVRAGSALLTVGDRLLAVQDDAYAAAWIEPVSRRIEPLLLAGTGEPLRKPDKPDFEAALALADGTLVLLGSGSRPTRTRIARIAPGKAIEMLDAPALYEAIAAAVATTPNIEGALVVDGALKLFHRGSGGQPSAILDFPADVLEGRHARILRITLWDLGAVGDVPLTFTDAAVFGATVLYLAVAENTPDAIVDGPVAGAAVGMLEAGAARWAPLLDVTGQVALCKPEGIAVCRDTVYLITDPDDPAMPAELCRLQLLGFS